MQRLTLITSLSMYTCGEEGDAEVDVFTSLSVYTYSEEGDAEVDVDHVPLCVYLR